MPTIPTPATATAVEPADAARSAALLGLSDLSVRVEPVTAGLRPDGRRARLLYVTLRPAAAHPGRDLGPRTCLALDTSDARALASLLLTQAERLEVTR